MKWFIVSSSLLMLLIMASACQPAAFEGIPNTGQWKASAKFCDFWFEITEDNRIVIGRFEYPCEIRCGIYEAYGHFEAFTPGTVFTTKDDYNQNPPPPFDPVVDYPVSGPEFTAGPFWLGITIEHAGRMPIAQFSLEASFTSATTISGKYNYQGAKPSSTMLVPPVCSGRFAAQWIGSH